MKVWISKYALTKGIYEVEASSYQSSIGSIKVSTQTFYRCDWHHSRGAAMAKADAMRSHRIASLEKSLKKMQGMKFE